MMGTSMMMGLGVIGTAAPEAEGVIRRPNLEAMQRFKIPDEIAPAVVPYIGCLLASHGVEVRGELDPRPKGVEKGADCSGQRKAAARDADALLRRIGGRSAAQRKSLIDATLAGADDFVRGSHLPSVQSTTGKNNAED